MKEEMVTTEGNSGRSQVAAGEQATEEVVAAWETNKRSSSGRSKGVAREEVEEAAEAGERWRSGSTARGGGEGSRKRCGRGVAGGEVPVAGARQQREGGGKAVVGRGGSSEGKQQEERWGLGRIREGKDGSTDSGDKLGYATSSPASSLQRPSL